MASLNLEIWNLLTCSQMDNLVTLRTGYLHRVPPHITQKFLRVRPSEKMDNLIKMLISRSKNRGTIVFCNYRKSATNVANACEENNIDAVKLDKSLSSKVGSYLLILLAIVDPLGNRTMFLSVLWTKFSTKLNVCSYILSKNLPRLWKLNDTIYLRLLA